MGLGELEGRMITILNLKKVHEGIKKEMLSLCCPSRIKNLLRSGGSCLTRPGYAAGLQKSAGHFAPA